MHKTSYQFQGYLALKVINSGKRTVIITFCIKTKASLVTGRGFKQTGFFWDTRKCT